LESKNNCIVRKGIVAVHVDIWTNEERCCVRDIRRGSFAPIVLKRSLYGSIWYYIRYSGYFYDYPKSGCKC
jgi:hypothetical protein